jgi:hypothetical protein
MRRSTVVFLICSFILTIGCVKSATNQQSSTTEQSVSASPTPGLANVNATPTASASPAASPSVVAQAGINPCSLLTSDEIRVVQGEPVKETKASQQASGGLVSLQCYYGLPTSANSISLALTETDPTKPGGTTAKEYWQQTFHGEETTDVAREGRKERDDEQNKTRAQKPNGKREEEDETGVPPKPVSGVGDEAFWTASRFSGALYVLQGQRFIRISVGGSGDEETKLKKTKTLAQQVLRRL